MVKKRIHTVFNWITGLFLVIAGICLISACVSIYQMGDRPFSPAAVAVAFSKISVPVYICLGLILAGWLLRLCLPTQEKKSVRPFYPMQLVRLQQRLDLNRISDASLKMQILSLRRKRTVHTMISYGLLGIFSSLFLLYGLNPANFHQSEINHSMAMAMLLFFPCLAIPFAYGCFTAFYSLRLTKKEIALSRQALNEAATVPAAPKEDHRLCLQLRLFFLSLGLFLLVFGFFTGGTADVLTKAINICTECVGLG